jgi:hypothetical protein
VSMLRLGTTLVATIPADPGERFATDAGVSLSGKRIHLDGSEGEIMHAATVAGGSALRLTIKVCKGLQAVDQGEH